MDGNKAAALVSYHFTEVAGIYPITPASPMAEYMDEFSVSGKLNYFGDKVKVVQMQSEAGAAGMVHGLLQNGILASTYTASQGLLLMIPNMYKIAGELLPCVINVAARTLATHALSIMGDHSDIYAARSTGFAFLCSSSVQEIMDLSNVAHLSTIKGRVPFVNFFDGFKTSHEYNKIDVIDFSKVKSLIDMDALNEFRKRSLDVDSPSTRGTNQGDQIYFQAVEARNKYYDELPDIVASYMMEINKITGRSYAPFNYYGDENATKVIVAMGSVCSTVREVIGRLSGVGLLEVHLYRPFSTKYFLEVLPSSVKKIAVLDRAKEAGSPGEALYLDVCEVIQSEGLDILVVGGRYGLSSKDTNPNDIEAVFEFLDSDDLHEFTLGIDDDVTHLSLVPTDTTFSKTSDELLIYGFGSDGMVTTSKDLLTIIGDHTDKFVQGYFEYDSKKSGGVTKSHLRFSDEKIDSPYYVEHPRVVVCSKDAYLSRYDVLKGIEENGIFILNTEKKVNEICLPKSAIETLKSKHITFYVINASKIARENDIPNKISMIMEIVILHIMKVIDVSLAKELVEKAIVKNFSRKGDKIVSCNIHAMEDAIKGIEKVDISLVKVAQDITVEDSIFSYLEHGIGNELKVSAFMDSCDGVNEPGLSKYEKRGISDSTPCYDKSKCISCNLCSFVCPHAVVRPYLLTEEEASHAPELVKENLKNYSKDSDLKFTIGISSLDCTGCSLCAGVCPTKAITMSDSRKNIDENAKRYEYLKDISDKQVMNVNTVKGSQFVSPDFKFHGACAGCGETNYLKLLTQLFKGNLMIANATGCSSIYGASLPNTPYDIPWANSLFEDNAEFGFGMRVAEDFMHEKVSRMMRENYDCLNKHNQELIDLYLHDDSKEASIRVYEELDYSDFEEIVPLKKYIKKKDIWLVGGDGWAYDIGFGGIDHVLANRENVNILVLDTEVYSNTGGQASKSTRSGAVAKFASNGKKTPKKDLARIARSYPHVYVATVSLGANYQQTINALVEANNYDGPSIVIAYSPCIAHGIKKGMSNSIEEEKKAVSSGYFPLFRYHPEKGELKIDSKADFSLYDEFLEGENRYRLDSDLLEENKNCAISLYETLKNQDEK